MKNLNKVSSGFIQKSITRTFISFLSLLIIFSLMLPSGCAKREKVIKIGAILPLTGPAALLGEWVRDGHELAIYEINREGGIKGKKIKYIVEDGMGDPKTSISAFRKLVEIDKVKIIFTTLSNVTLALIPLLEKYDVLLYTNAAHPKITGDSKLVFRHGQVAEHESFVILEFLLTKKINNIGIIYLNDDYGVLFSKKLREESEKRGIVVKSFVSYEKEETDFKTEVQKLIENNPEAVIVAGYGKAIGFILKRLKEKGYENKIICTSLFNSPEVLEIAGDAASGVFYTDFAIDYSDSAVRNLTALYEKKFGRKIHPLSIFSYNDIFLLKKAIEKVGYNPSEISSFLLKLKKCKLAGEEVTIKPSGDILIPLEIKKYKR